MFDIEDEQRLQWGEQRAQKVHVVKGEMISYPLLEGYGAFYRPSQWSINNELITFTSRRRSI
jgi:hypothetical protein